MKIIKRFIVGAIMVMVSSNCEAVKASYEVDAFIWAGIVADDVANANEICDRLRSCIFYNGFKSVYVCMYICKNCELFVDSVSCLLNT